MSGMDGARAGRRRQAARTAAANRSPRKCPRCLRNAALSSRIPLQGRDEPYVGSVRVCNYCGHEVGIAHGKPFGRAVTPQPGARGGRLLPATSPEEPRAPESLRGVTPEALRRVVDWLDSEQTPDAVVSHHGVSTRIGDFSVRIALAPPGPVVVFEVSTAKRDEHDEIVNGIPPEEREALGRLLGEVVPVVGSWNGLSSQCVTCSFRIDRELGEGVRRARANYVPFVTPNTVTGIEGAASSTSLCDCCGEPAVTTYHPEPADADLCASCVTALSTSEPGSIPNEPTSPLTEEYRHD